MLSDRSLACEAAPAVCAHRISAEQITFRPPILQWHFMVCSQVAVQSGKVWKTLSTTLTSPDKLRDLVWAFGKEVDQQNRAHMLLFEVPLAKSAGRVTGLCFRNLRCFGEHKLQQIPMTSSQVGIEFLWSTLIGAAQDTMMAKIPASNIQLAQFIPRLVLENLKKSVTIGLHQQVRQVTPTESSRGLLGLLKSPMWCGRRLW